MKKLLILLILLGLLLVTTTTVFTGGDQVRGGTGNGAGDQNTEEVGCEVQPCFADAPQPGPTGAGDNPYHHSHLNSNLKYLNQDRTSCNSSDLNFFINFQYYQHS